MGTPGVHWLYSAFPGEWRDRQYLDVSGLQLLLTSPGGVSAKKAMCQKIEKKSKIVVF